METSASVPKETSPIFITHVMDYNTIVLPQKIFCQLVQKKWREGKKKRKKLECNCKTFCVKRKRKNKAFNSRNIYTPTYSCRTEHFEYFFLCLTWGMVPPWSDYKKFRNYQGIQIITISFNLSARKKYFQHPWPRSIEVTYLFMSWL